MGFLAASFSAMGATEEQINKRFEVAPGGVLAVEVDFGSIEVTTNANINEVVVDVWRKVTMKNKADEEAYLKDRPVLFARDGDTLSIRSVAKSKPRLSWRSIRLEGKYRVSVPAEFSARLQTSGGGIQARDLKGDVNARTSGGGLNFARLRGKLDANTSGGGIHVDDCAGTINLHTSGGGLDITGGSGSLDGHTSGGGVRVSGFRGPAKVHTSGGGLTLENMSGAIEGSTSGGSIRASLVNLTEPLKLETSGGGVRLSVPGNAAFDLDASTSAGGVRSELAVTVIGKMERSRIKGTVNGGGKQVYLRSSGGNIDITKL